MQDLDFRDFRELPLFLHVEDLLKLINLTIANALTVKIVRSFSWKSPVLL